MDEQNQSLRDNYFRYIHDNLETEWKAGGDQFPLAWDVQGAYNALAPSSQSSF